MSRERVMTGDPLAGGCSLGARNTEFKGKPTITKEATQVCSHHSCHASYCKERVDVSVSRESVLNSGVERV